MTPRPSTPFTSRRITFAALAVTALALAASIVVLRAREDGHRAADRPDRGSARAASETGAPTYSATGVVVRIRGGEIDMRTTSGTDLTLVADSGLGLAHMASHAALAMPVRLTYVRSDGVRRAFQEEDLPTLTESERTRMFGAPHPLEARELARLRIGMNPAEVMVAVGPPLYDQIAGRTNEELCWQWERADGPRDRFYTACADDLSRPTVSRLDANGR